MLTAYVMLYCVTVASRRFGSLRADLAVVNNRGAVMPLEKNLLDLNRNRSPMRKLRCEHGESDGGEKR